MVGVSVIRPLRTTLAALAFVALPLLGLGVTPAQAAFAFPDLLGEISGPAPATSFTALDSESVAVNHANGHILVADSGTGLVYDFTSPSDTAPAVWNGSTTPASSFGGGHVAVAVDNSNGDVYVADATNAVIDKFDASGTLISTFGDTTPTPDGQLAGIATPDGSFSPGFGGTFGIAVDQSTHDLYAIDAGHQVIDVFDSSGVYLPAKQITATPAGLYGCGGNYADGIAVNPTSGHLFVSDSCPVQTFEFDSSGSFVKVLDGSNTPDGSFGGGYTSVALDNSSGDIYISDTSHRVVDAFDSSGNYLGQITGTPGNPNGGVAVGQATGNIYVSDAATGSVKIFGPGVILPEATTNPASDIAQTTATLNGHLDPQDAGDVTDCHFEYTDLATFTSQGYTGATTVPCDQSTPISSPADVTASTTGLTLGTAYHFRLVASSDGVNFAKGQDRTFATKGPGFGVKSLSVKVLDQNGQPYTQAGGHPYELQTKIDFNTTVTADGVAIPDGQVKDLTVALPPGLNGNPTALPSCNTQDLIAGGVVGVGGCAPETQIGMITLDVPPAQIQNGLDGPFPVYNITPPDGLPAQFGFVVPPAGVIALIDSGVRTGSDYAVSSGLTNTSTIPQLMGSTLTLWGDPADPSHNLDRHCGCSITIPDVPFFTNPTSCGPLTATIEADSWENPGNFVTNSDTMPATTGCEKLKFNPSLSLQPDTASADSPSGLNVDLKAPQDGLTDPAGLSAANLKKAVVTLPPGVSVNPAAADGLAACTPAQIGLDNASEPTCPDASKVGTSEIHTPLLPDSLKGSLYLATPHDNPFDTLLAGYLVAEGDGVLLKLAGRFDTDPVTGQITATFDQNPQQPFDDLKLNLFGGARAPIATPPTCGTYTTNSDLTPWSTPAIPDATSQDSFQVTSGPNGGPCPNLTDPSRFTPGFQAGTVSPQAGTYSPLMGKASRQDGSQPMRGLNLDLPPGLTGKLAGIATCPDSALAAAASNPGAAELANPSCPAASKLGTVNVAAGAGSTPFHVQGTIYLTGPYKGAPISVAVITPAVAGPFDLGTVVVRAAAQIDPTTAQIHIQSDQLPTILQGIPLHIRSVAIAANRDQFTLNPTNCNPMSLDGTIFGSPTAAAVSNRFQAGGCAALGFKPHLKLSLKGGTKRNGHPAFTSVVTYPTAGAYTNLAKVQVTLPPTMQLDQAHIKAPCTRPQFAANACPAASVIGAATAATPLLDTPLSGPVYLLTNGHALPDVMVDLKGPASQPIEVHLDGVVDTVHARLRTTFVSVPDAPVSRAVIKLVGANKGLLVNNTNLCAHKNFAAVHLDAQDGDFIHSNTKVSVPCAKAHKHHKHHKRHSTH